MTKGLSPGKDFKEKNLPETITEAHRIHVQQLNSFLWVKRWWGLVLESGRPEAGYFSVLLSYLSLAESRVEKKAIWAKRATDGTREKQAALRNIFHIAGKTRGPGQGRHSSARDIPGSIVLASLEGVPQQRQKSTDRVKD